MTQQLCHRPPSTGLANLHSLNFRCTSRLRRRDAVKSLDVV